MNKQSVQYQSDWKEKLNKAVIAWEQLAEKVKEYSKERKKHLAWQKKILQKYEKTEKNKK